MKNWLTALKNTAQPGFTVFFFIIILYHLFFSESKKREERLDYLYFDGVLCYNEGAIEGDSDDEVFR